MENLPVEMIHHIFRYIQLADLITARLVCRKFKFVVEQKKIDELILDKKTHDWFYSKKPINPNYVISMGPILFVSPTFRLEQNVRRLRTEFTGTYYAARFINGLQQLEQLEILFYNGHGVYGFKLPKLRILKAETYENPDRSKMRLAFEASNLEAIYCLLPEMLRIENPTTVKYYEAGACNEKIEIFRNLEFLKLSDYIDRNMLTSFGSLKELRITWNCLAYDWNHPTDAYVMNTVAHLMKQRLVQRRTDFRLYLQGVEIRDKNLFIDNTYLNDQDFQMRNYALLDQAPSPGVVPLDYSSLLKLKNEIPADFFSKFPNIAVVKVTKNTANGDQLIQFLKNIGDRLQKLYLRNTGLSQAHYNQLAQLKLQILKIDEKRDLSYKFVLQMKELSVLQIRQEFPDAVVLAMKKLKRTKNHCHIQWKVPDGHVLVNRSFANPKLFSLMWFDLDDPDESDEFDHDLGGNMASFKMNKNLELITGRELAAFYHSHICKTGVITRQTLALKSVKR